MESTTNTKNSTNTNDNTQEQWDKIVNACLIAGSEVLSKNEKESKSENQEIKRLSEKQKKLRLDKEACKDKSKRQALQRERNEILKEIHDKVRKEKEDKIESLVTEVERHKNDSTRMYHAIRALKVCEPKKKITVQGEHGLVTNEKEQTEIITEFFQNMFHKDTEEVIPEAQPKEMTKPFTATEVRKAIDSLKSNKSPGLDNLQAELIKHGPKEIHERIANLLNDIAKTGTFPKEIKEGILVPLPKPGKPQGPPENLRPIILLSVIRKILAICMIRRTIDKLNNKIPLTQAAYREGRSTTEQVYTMKTLAEKAITSQCYEIYILMIDMSKAFDTVKRGQLLNDLKDILEDDELHMIQILIKDVKLRVRCGKEIGKEIETNVGVPQGDCLSPVLFTLYLAQALKEERDERSEEHNYTKTPKTSEELLPTYLRDHTYSVMKENHLMIDQQYADDISWLSTSKSKIEEIENNIPGKLQSRNLKVNHSKTEKYCIKRQGQEDWKECKYLGTILDTEKDIKRRKGLAISAYTKLKYILESKRTNINLRIRTFDAFVGSIFLYNSELWTLTKQMEQKIDAFQRSLLRKMLGIRWPDKITNENLHRETNTTNWSKEIKRRRLSWYGHLLRLQEGTPAKQALEETRRKTKKPQGKPKMTWHQKVNKDLEESGANLKLIETVAKNRTAWRAVVGSAMSDDVVRI